MVNDGWITTDMEQQHPPYVSLLASPGALTVVNSPSKASRFWRMFDFGRRVATMMNTFRHFVEKARGILRWAEVRPAACAKPS